jgi:predicted nucleic acid-binding protein
MRRIDEQDVMAVPATRWQVMTVNDHGRSCLGIFAAESCTAVCGETGPVKKLSIYRDKVRALMTLGLEFEPCHESDLLGKALEIQERHGLLTNDSLIAAIALRIEADVLVSADTRFQAIKELRTYAPSDVKLPSIQ